MVDAVPATSREIKTKTKANPDQPLLLEHTPPCRKGESLHSTSCHLHHTVFITVPSLKPQHHLWCHHTQQLHGNKQRESHGRSRTSFLTDGTSRLVHSQVSQAANSGGLSHSPAARRTARRVSVEKNTLPEKEDTEGAEEMPDLISISMGKN